MRIGPFLFSAFITALLIFALDKKWGSVPPLGKFLSPQQGFWQNAEPRDHNFNETLSFKNVSGKTEVFIDERLVPHVFAENDRDAFFVQGFLHAKFRLWQMEFQTLAAAGRISEILGKGDAYLRYDREQRRLGMVSAAETALVEIEADPVSRTAADAYTEGVNAYIENLSQSELPIEYKLLDYKPELWSNLKGALFLKMMSKDLAGYDRDLEFTNAKSVFNTDELNLIFPEFSDSSVPIIPKSTSFSAPGIIPVAPPGADSVYFERDTLVTANETNKPDRNNGSNSWAVDGTKTKSGAPILNNDPHLNLTLPSIWFEMQISTPDMNVYGATFPGAPNVIIGFNDDVAFGFTNSMRDVKDYYAIRFKDGTKREYWYNGAWKKAVQRIEIIKIRGAPDYLDTVAYTQFGPAMYDHSFGADSNTNSAIAVRWIAHEPSNEILTWLKLNKAKNYDDCEAAIKTFVCPGQNMLFASRGGQIGLWHQGQFPARWPGQGLYVMPGEDSSYEWQGFIPQEENPHVMNPAGGYIQSANQHPVDSSYPYFAPGNYITPRGIRISERLSAMQGITPQDMMGLQNDYYNSAAEDFVPYLVKHTHISNLTDAESKYLDEIRDWDYYATPGSRATTIYQAWLDSLRSGIWDDEFERIPTSTRAGNNLRPDEQTLIEALLKDSVFKYADDIRTVEKETIRDQITMALKKATAGLLVEEKNNGLVWWKHKNPAVYHLLRTSVLPFASTGLEVGGWANTVNAIKSTHGPSWRMIVHLTTPTEAYGIYPGGQSGNPGSRFYQNFIGDWSKGKYYTLWMMKLTEAGGKRVKWKMTFTNA